MVSHLFPHKLSSSVKETCHCLDSRCEMTDLKSEAFFYLERVSQKMEKNRCSYGLACNVDWWCWHVVSSGRFQTQGLQWHLCQRAKRGWYLLCVPHTLPSRLPGLLWHDYWWRRMDGESHSSQSQHHTVRQQLGAKFGRCFRSPLSCFFFSKYIWIDWTAVGIKITSNESLH